MKKIITVPVSPLLTKFSITKDNSFCQFFFQFQGHSLLWKINQISALRTSPIIPVFECSFPEEFSFRFSLIRKCNQEVQICFLTICFPVVFRFTCSLTVGALLDCTQTIPQSWVIFAELKISQRCHFFSLKKIHIFYRKKLFFVFHVFYFEVIHTNKYISIKLSEIELNSIKMSIEKCHFPHILDSQIASKLSVIYADSTKFIWEQEIGPNSRETIRLLQQDSTSRGRPKSPPRSRCRNQVFQICKGTLL